MTVRLLAVVLVALVGACGNEAPSTATAREAPPPDPAEVVPASVAIAGAYVPELDPHTLTDAEVAKALPEDVRARCTFRYTADGEPVVVAGLASGADAVVAVARLNGRLVLFHGARDLERPVFESDPARLAITPVGGRAGRGGATDADLHFEVRPGLSTAYRGRWSCDPP